QPDGERLPADGAAERAWRQRRAAALRLGQAGGGRRVGAAGDLLGYGGGRDHRLERDGRGGGDRAWGRVGDLAAAALASAADRAGEDPEGGVWLAAGGRAVQPGVSKIRAVAGAAAGGAAG